MGPADFAAPRKAPLGSVAVGEESGNEIGILAYYTSARRDQWPLVNERAIKRAKAACPIEPCV